MVFEALALFVIHVVIGIRAALTRTFALVINGKEILGALLASVSGLAFQTVVERICAGLALAMLVGFVLFEQVVARLALGGSVYVAFQ